MEWFTPPQRKWFLDDSRFKICLKPRQQGITEVEIARATMRSATLPGHKTYLVKLKREDAANELLRRAKTKWIPVFQKFPSLKDSLRIVNESQYKIEFANGAQLIATATKPQSMRGNIGSFVLDEIDHWEDRHLEQVDESIFPTIRNYKANPHCRVSLISTPWIEGRLFQNIWTNKAGGYGHWSRHYIDFLKWGPVFGLDPEQIEREHRAVPAKYRREYLCEWVGTDHFFFDKNVISKLQTDEFPARGRVWCGVDVGKKNDHTAVVFMRESESGLVIGDYFLLRHMSYEDIASKVANLLISYGAVQVRVDETNNSAFLDSLKAKTSEKVRELRGEKVWPETFTLLKPWVEEYPTKVSFPKIKGIHFTNTWKHDQVSKLLEYIERDELRFCFDNVFEWRNSQNEFVRLDRPVLLEDMSHVVQSSTKTGKPRYDVERTEDGHGDAFFALLLVMDAHKSSNNILQVG